MVKAGWAMTAHFALFMLEFALTVLFVIPRTALLGAFMWIALWLRDERVRKVFPLLPR